MDGAKEDVSEHFANVYDRIYNSVDDKEEMSRMYSRVNKSIDTTSLSDVDLVTNDIVREATMNLESNRNDPIFDFNSDCLKYAPLIVFEHLTCLMKSFLVHAHVRNILLLATLIPIPKNKLGDLSSSNNYRSIAISSLILKIFDWIIILLFEESLGLDNLQFSYQKNCSTTMCTWMIIEGISYFIRNGSEVFTCTMDMTKTFHMVCHCVLLGKMMNQKILCHIYSAAYEDVYITIR